MARSRRKRSSSPARSARSGSPRTARRPGPGGVPIKQPIEVRGDGAPGSAYDTERQSRATKERLMTTQRPLVTGTDFITVATKDIDAAMEFYGDVLGLRFSKRWGQMPAAEFETGTLTIAVMQSDAFGLEFSPTTIRSRCVWTTSRPPARSSSRAA